MSYVRAGGRLKGELQLLAGRLCSACAVVACVGGSAREGAGVIFSQVAALELVLPQSAGLRRGWSVDLQTSSTLQASEAHTISPGLVCLDFQGTHVSGSAVALSAAQGVLLGAVRQDGSCAQAERLLRCWQQQGMAVRYVYRHLRSCARMARSWRRSRLRVRGARSPAASLYCILCSCRVTAAPQSSSEAPAAVARNGVGSNSVLYQASS